MNFSRNILYRFAIKEVAGGWERLHNEELHNLYPSINIIKLIKSRTKWAGHVARIGEMRCAQNIDLVT
jgi:hypothetical protein